MYYIKSEESTYYAGKCCSDNETQVWKNHWTRALGFDTVVEARTFAEVDKVKYSDIEYQDF